MTEQTPRNAGQWLIVGLVVFYALALLVAPVFAVISGAFQDGIQPVINALTSSDAIIALRLTVMLATAATFINTIFGVLIAWVLVRSDFPGKKLFDALVDMPFVVSPVIVGYVMIVLFGRTGWLKDLPFQVAFSWPGMLIVTVFVSLPFVIREVMPVLASLTREQEEAAKTLGASRFTVFRRIVFPAIRHGVGYGIVLTFARAVGEFGAAAVIGGGLQGVTETATIYIFRSTHDRNEIGAYSMAILLGVLAVVILTTMNYLRHQLEQKGTSHVHQS
jgi:sulfate/thiosulfate transport system permease protein